MSSNLQNSIWPNAGGTLGQIKVQIPDGVTTPWPAGDALVGNFVYNQGKLVGFVDTKALIANESKSTTFPYDYVNITVDGSLKDTFTFNGGNRTKYLIVNYTDTSNSGDTIVLGTKYLGCETVDDVVTRDPDYLTNDIVDGVWTESLADLTDGREMFYENENLTTFNSKLSSLTDGESMFDGCVALTTFNCSDLSSLENGEYMFYGCDNLTSFSSNLSSLTNGEYMFSGCDNLTSFSSNLSSLTDGYSMFYGCTELNAFNCSDLSSLTAGRLMFDSCYNLTSFTSDISSLVNGDLMFYDCYNLTSFTSDISSLTYGGYMFHGCKLDTPSVQNIANTIKDVNDLTNDEWGDVLKEIIIGIGNTTPNAEETEAFNTMVEKGWTVYVNGSSDSDIFNPTALIPTDEEMPQVIPFWAKPVPSDEKHACYVDSEGNFFNILGGQFIYGDDLMNYGQFLNEEDAAMQMRLTKIEK